MIAAALLLGALLSASADPAPFLFGMFKQNSNKELTVTNFEYTNCTNDVDIKLTDLSLSIDDDDIEISGSLSVSENITALSVDVVMKYKNLVKWPCKNRIGSCHYDNMCDILNDHTATCMKEMTALNLTLPCECPITKGDYSLPSIKLPIPDHWKNMMTGKHTAQIKGEIDGELVLCYNFEVQLSM